MKKINQFFFIRDYQSEVTVDDSYGKRLDVSINTVAIWSLIFHSDFLKL